MDFKFPSGYCLFSGDIVAVKGLISSISALFDWQVHSAGSQFAGPSSYVLVAEVNHLLVLLFK